MPIPRWQWNVAMLSIAAVILFLWWVASVILGSFGVDIHFAR